jgi:hypothetical protein
VARADALGNRTVRHTRLPSGRHLLILVPPH